MSDRRGRVDANGQTEGSRRAEALSKARRKLIEIETISTLVGLRESGSEVDRVRVSASSEILKHLSRKEETARRTREYKARRRQERAEEARKLERDLGGPLDSARPGSHGQACR